MGKWSNPPFFLISAAKTSRPRIDTGIIQQQSEKHFVLYLCLCPMNGIIDLHQSASTQ